MTKDEALRLALEALEYPGPSWLEARQPAITAIKQALEQPEPEPVAYIHRQGNHWEVSERFLSDDEKSRGWTEEPLYSSPQRAEGDVPKRKPEPRAWLYESPMSDGSVFVGASAERLTIGVGVTPDTKETPLCVCSPKREWQGLTGDERDTIVRMAGDLLDAICLTESKLEEKNT